MKMQEPHATLSKVCLNPRSSRTYCHFAWIGSVAISGKTVTHLEYQAYSKLALKTIRGIIHEAAASVSRSDHHPALDAPVPALIRCVVHHRLGTVPVGEPSIGMYDSQSILFMIREIPVL
jgi:MoaE protein